MTSFAVIRERAERRKGGAEALQRLLPHVLTHSEMSAVPDHRILSQMARRVFCTGFSWSVVDAKWAGFEEAFLGFEPGALLFQPDEFWDALTSDRRIIRNGMKIMSVRRNAQFISDIAGEHGSFGRFLADWPPSDQIGLLQVLAKRGSRLGGATGQMLLRFLGWDGFMLSQDVVTCLRDAGLDISTEAKSKRDLVRVQERFNVWADETGLPHAHISRICACSIGENRTRPDMVSDIGASED